jgi:outer membrane biosynthesis protein TonB
VTARAGAAARNVGTRARAGREIARLRGELLELEAERGRKLQALGEAVYLDDEQGTKALRAELAELGAAVEAKEAEMQAVAERARERMDRARLEVQPTEVGSVPEQPSPTPEPAPAPPTPVPVPEPSPTPVPEPYPPPDEATPPEPARIPEPGPKTSAKKRKK